MKKRNTANIMAKECIVTALIQLSDQKPFSTITISELTERAGVSRMTYYRNYTSKEDVFKSYMDELVEQYYMDISRIKKPETHGEYNNILHCFRYFEKYNDFVSCLINIGMGGLLLNAITTYIISVYYSEDDPDTTLYYQLQSYAGSLFNVYIAWITRGAKESVEMLSQIIYNQLHPLPSPDQFSSPMGSPLDI